MLIKLKAFAHRYAMVLPGDKVVCAVSGGADSMALLWAMYLLREKLDIHLSAAHFNHRLRGEESDRDQAFVEKFCADYQIPFISGSAQVVTGAKGLEAAARDARYAFLRTLPGKVATAHTADDNAETLLMHLIRGTGLKGLGGIAPVNGQFIRPMLTVTREEVLAFLAEYSIPYVEDSSNAGDDFLRNRLRHHVMPLLRRENPSLAPHLTAMALQLRQDEAALQAAACREKTASVSALRQMEPAIRSRVLADFLQSTGVKEPESEHIAALEKLVFSLKPSAKAAFPNGVTVFRNYDALEVNCSCRKLETRELACPGVIELPEQGVRIRCDQNDGGKNTPTAFAVIPQGKIMIRARQAGDSIRLTGGTKTLKKLFIDRKIPAARREQIPVLADAGGVLGVVGVGANLDRLTEDANAVKIYIDFL